MWPNLSPLINDSLAKLTEFVLRDYVSSWYAKVDEHVVFVDPIEEGGEEVVVVDVEEEVLEEEVLVSLLVVFRLFRLRS